jgi:putative tricarboxylic transport membrane protein
MPMNIRLWIGPIFWFAVGFYVLTSAFKLGIGDVSHPGPGFVFCLAALVLLVLNAVDLFLSLRASLSPTEEKAKPLWRGLRWQKVLIVLGALAAYVYLFNMAGFAIATLLLMLALLKVVEPTPWHIAVTGAVAITLVSYAVFSLWLKVPFPEGALGF